MTKTQLKAEAKRLAKLTFNELLDKRPAGTYIIAFRKKSFYVNNIRVRTGGGSYRSWTGEWVYGKHEVEFLWVFGERKVKTSDLKLTTFDTNTQRFTTAFEHTPFTTSDGVPCFIADAAAVRKIGGLE